MSATNGEEGHWPLLEIAQRLGKTPAQVRYAVLKHRIDPVIICGPCYRGYDAAGVEAIKAALVKIGAKPQSVSRRRK